MKPLDGECRRADSRNPIRGGVGELHHKTGKPNSYIDRDEANKLTSQTITPASVARSLSERTLHHSQSAVLTPTPGVGIGNAGSEGRGGNVAAVCVTGSLRGLADDEFVEVHTGGGDLKDRGLRPVSAGCVEQVVACGVLRGSLWDVSQLAACGGYNNSTHGCRTAQENKPVMVIHSIPE